MGTGVGDYLTTAGIEQLAREVFLPTGIEDYQAIECAIALLLGHELGHLLVDVALAAADLGRGTDAAGGTIPLVKLHVESHRGFACPREEAFCEAHALSFLDESLTRMSHLREEQWVAVLHRARLHVQEGLPGYREGAQIKSPRDVFAALRDLLMHAGIVDGEAGALLADLPRRASTASELPVNLVVTPDSAYSRGQWRTSR